MNQEKFDLNLSNWRKRPDFQNPRVNLSNDSPYRPAWFPSSWDQHIGTVTDGWTYQLFRRDGDDHLYLYVW
jgi:hypothetical protein